MKYVKIKFKYVDKIYEYKTQLDLEVGKVYKITNSSSYRQMPMRGKVVSISDAPDNSFPLTEIYNVSEEEDDID